MILKARWVLPVSAPPIREGVVCIVSDRIAAVGPAAALRCRPGSVTDLGQVILTPGLVNPHTHLELTGYAGRLAPQPFWSWLTGLMEFRREPGQTEREQRGVREGAWQSLRAGVTCVGDVSRRNLNWQVLRSIPIRKVCFTELLSIADDPPRDADELRAAVAQVGEDTLLTVGISPHAPYTVPPEHIRAAVGLADELGRPWCMHWAETPQERGFLGGDAGALPAVLRELQAERGLHAPRMEAIELLAQCTRGLRPGALAHCNYLEPDEVERLAALHHTVMYCPRAHRYFGHALHPYRELMHAGVSVAIATDSLASNENLSLLEELRHLRCETRDAPPADVLLAMATLCGARALGLDGLIGSLEIGKRADLAAFPCAADLEDPVDWLVCQAPAPSGVWVDGERVVLRD